MAETSLERARAVASAVRDPELPVLTLADLGVLRGVTLDRTAEGETEVVVAITPTYSGCPALATMRDDLVRSLGVAGFARVRVAVELSPAWSSDWISESGREALRRYGISPPGPVPARQSAGVPLTLLPTRREVACPRCGSLEAELVSEFGSTSCKALYSCAACLEPFEHVKEI